jgi:hypothetical protein
MSRIVFLLEEYSMKILLEGLLPRIFPSLGFLCVSHEGKQDLEKSIVRKLRAWREPGVRFLILCDNDGGECKLTKQRLSELCKQGERPDSIVRIVCQELEAWYFGAPAALAEAFQRDDLKSIAAKARFRDPDKIARPSRALGELIPEFQKVGGARKMAKLLTKESESRSFHSLVSGIEKLLH